MNGFLDACPDEQPFDWNELWKRAVARKWPRMGDRSSYWNRRAPSFARRSPASAYTKAFLDILAPQPHWSVLDVGCGTGTLALPLAGLVRSITAMDFSEAMIERLTQGFTDLRIRNIRPLQAGWEDDWAAAGIGAHDVAIASRSLVVEDLEGAVRKLDQAARHRVYIASPAGDGPLDRPTLEAIGRPFHKGPDYIYVYNLLHQIGIYANIAIITAEEERTFGTPEEVLEFYRVLIDDLDAREDARLRAHLSEQLIPKGRRWALRCQAPIRWALIWWEKGPA